MDILRWKGEIASSQYVVKARMNRQLEEYRRDGIAVKVNIHFGRSIASDDGVLKWRGREMLEPYDLKT